MPDLGSCPNCNAELKNGTFSANLPVDEHTAKAISGFTLNKSTGYCGKCYPSLLSEAQTNRYAAINSAKRLIEEDLVHVPVITLQHPHN